MNRNRNASLTLPEAFRPRRSTIRLVAASFAIGVSMTQVFAQPSPNVNSAQSVHRNVTRGINSEVASL